MKKNDIIEIDITDTGIGGEGIGHYAVSLNTAHAKGAAADSDGGSPEGMTFFVKDAIAGDRIRARVTKLKKNYGYARVEEIIRPSTLRVEAPCPVARPCGGCQIMEMSYEGQLAMKERLVRERLQRIGGFSGELLERVMEPVIGHENPERIREDGIQERQGEVSGSGERYCPWHYRNKAQYPVRRDKNGNTVIGFFAAHSHRIVETPHCLIGAEIFDDFIDRIRKNPAVVPYDEESGKGLLRHVLLRCGTHTGNVMVCLVVNAAGASRRTERMVEALTRELVRTGTYKVSTGSDWRLCSICVNYNDSRGNVILGGHTDTVWGTSYLEDSMDGIRFRISAPSFYQVNTLQAERLYRKALEYADLTGRETVWDLYCGIGTISLFLAQKAKQVYGVEVVPEAIENARENARLNGITNVEFFEGKAEEVLLPDEHHPDVIVVDPPRKGCDERCLETMLAMQPERMVYVSCDPATLARDLRVLCEGGYELKAVTPVDQFCHSVHVETVVGLQRIDM